MSIPATLTLNEAAARCWDVVVVGAGPAGALAARQLAHAGVCVLLVDRASFPRWKVCGCCLNAGALGTLRSVGLGDLTKKCGAVPVGRICLAAGRRSAVLSLPGGVALSREMFDSALIEAALVAGVSFLPQTGVAVAHVGNVPGRGMLKTCPTATPERTLLLRQDAAEQTVRARLLLAADGLNGRLLADEPGCVPVAAPGSRLGAGAVAPAAPAFFTPGTIFMACGAGGYAGLVRLEDGRLDVAAALDAWLVRQQRGVAGAVATLLAGTDWPRIPDLETLPWRGTPALTRRPSRIAGPRFFLLGDAAGYVEPFTGEGMAWALASAVALTPLAVASVRQWRPDLARRWQALHRHLFAPRRRLCRAVALGLRHPRLVRGLLGLLSWAPFLAAPVVRQLQR